MNIIETITNSFNTAGGHEVEITGKLTQYNDGDGYVKVSFDFTVKGFGSQGGTVNRSRFSKNGVDYAAIVGALPLTQEQLDIYTKMMSTLMDAKAKHPLTLAQDDYSTYEDVERKHPWMKGTY